MKIDVFLFVIVCLKMMVFSLLLLGFGLGMVYKFVLIVVLEWVRDID